MSCPNINSSEFKKTESLIGKQNTYKLFMLTNDYVLDIQENDSPNTAIQKLKLNPKDCTVLLDGGLHAPIEYKDQATETKGDEKHAVIALASIYAKVTRDTYMHKQAKLYPEYGFENHVGYGTAAHYKAIKKGGLTPLHRKSFLKRVIK